MATPTYDELKAMYPGFAEYVDWARDQGYEPAGVDAAIIKEIATRRRHYLDQGASPQQASMRTLADFNATPAGVPGIKPPGPIERVSRKIGEIGARVGPKLVKAGEFVGGEVAAGFYPPRGIPSPHREEGRALGQYFGGALGKGAALGYGGDITDPTSGISPEAVTAYERFATRRPGLAAPLAFGTQFAGETLPFIAGPLAGAKGARLLGGGARAALAGEAGGAGVVGGLLPAESAGQRAAQAGISAASVPVVAGAIALIRRAAAELAASRRAGVFDPYRRLRAPRRTPPPPIEGRPAIPVRIPERPPATLEARRALMDQLLAGEPVVAPRPGRNLPKRLVRLMKKPVRPVSRVTLPSVGEKTARVPLKAVNIQETAAFQKMREGIGELRGEELRKALRAAEAQVEPPLTPEQRAFAERAREREVAEFPALMARTRAAHYASPEAKAARELESARMNKEALIYEARAAREKQLLKEELAAERAADVARIRERAAAADKIYAAKKLEAVASEAKRVRDLPLRNEEVAAAIKSAVAAVDKIRAAQRLAGEDELGAVRVFSPATVEALTRFGRGAKRIFAREAFAHPEAVAARLRFVGAKTALARSARGYAKVLTKGIPEVDPRVGKRVLTLRDLGDPDPARILPSVTPKQKDTQAVVRSMLSETDRAGARISKFLAERGDNKVAAAVQGNLGRYQTRSYAKAIPTADVVSVVKRAVSINRYVLPGTKKGSLVFVDKSGSPLFAQDLPRLIGKPQAGLDPAGTQDWIQTQIAARLTKHGAPRKMTAAEFAAWAEGHLGRRQEQLLPVLSIGGVKDAARTKILRARSLYDPLARALRGEHKNLGVVLNTYVNVKRTEAALRFTNQILRNVTRYAKEAPDEMVRIPQLQWLADTKDATAPRWMVDMLQDNLGFLGRGQGIGEQFAVVRAFNKTMNWFRMKNTILSPSGPAFQAGSNFINMWLAGNHPMNPRNFRAHLMAWKEVQRPGKIFKLLEKEGRLEGFGEAEAVNRADQILADAALSGTPAGMWERSARAADTAVIKASAFYSAFDRAAKISTYIKATGLDGGRGIALNNWSKPRRLSHQEALQYIDDWFINFRRTSKLVDVLRKVPATSLIVDPYISAKLLSLPIWGRALARRPVDLTGFLTATALGAGGGAWLYGKTDLPGAETARAAFERKKIERMASYAEFPESLSITLENEPVPLDWEIGGLIPNFEVLGLLKDRPGEDVAGDTVLNALELGRRYFFSGPLAAAVVGPYKLNLRPEEPAENQIAVHLAAQLLVPGSAQNLPELFRAIEGVPGPLGTERDPALKAAAIAGFRTTKRDPAYIYKQISQLNAKDKDLASAQARIKGRLDSGEITLKQAVDQTIFLYNKRVQTKARAVEAKVAPLR